MLSSVIRSVMLFDLLYGMYQCFGLLLWRTGVLAEGFPLLFGAPFIIFSCIVICIMLTFC